MTYNNLLENAYNILKQNGIEDYKYDARQILLEDADLDFANFLCICEKNLEDFLSGNDLNYLIDVYEHHIDLRSKKVPLQYIFGKSYFCGLEFDVNQDVLIPRQDTETLVERFLQDNTDENIEILDMCTGSGCIAVSLACLGKYKRIVGADISKDALNIAAHNAEKLLNDNFDDIKNEIFFIKSDLFSNINTLDEKIGFNKFDCITCNPPYIRSKDIEKLDESVKYYEPHLALDGDIDGLKFYKQIAKDAKNYLKNNGKIYLEIGYDQKEDVTNIFQKENYKIIDVIKDFENRDRVVIVQYEQ